MMFTETEILHVTQKPEFSEDFKHVQQFLVEKRLKQSQQHYLASSSRRLSYFVEAVLASAPNWENHHKPVLCQIAAEISEALAAQHSNPGIAKNLRIRAALLYELAGLPVLASAALQREDFSEYLISFFKREGEFAKLSNDFPVERVCDTRKLVLGELALLDDAIRYAEATHQTGLEDIMKFSKNQVSNIALNYSRYFNIGLTSSEISAFLKLLQERVKRATITNVDSNLFPSLRRIKFPAELLPAQKAAIDGGLLNKSLASWGFAAPTGSGKTFLSRLLISENLLDDESSKILYIVPSKALVSEISVSLQDSLSKIGYKVLALSAQLVDLDDQEKSDLDNASVVVLTPEKADMLLRLNIEFLNSVRLVIIDEAHHIESGTRGALLELYLWRLKKIMSSHCRFIFLSAVAPNIKDIACWIDPNGSAVSYKQRPTRMRVGIYKWEGKGVAKSGKIFYEDGTFSEVVNSRAESGIKRGICELASFLNSAGPVLIIAKGKKECENIAMELKEWLKEKGSLKNQKKSIKESDIYQSLDTCLKREMYSKVELRDLIKHRIAYHHAGLPPNVRHGVEESIRSHHIDFVVATTTLAEGVNFPFSSVIVQSLAVRDAPEAGRPARFTTITPRSFWNIAGRAGRPGFDAEGQVVLFYPSLQLDKINTEFHQYLKPELSSLSPVKSALASAMELIEKELKENNYSDQELSRTKLPDTMSRQAKGAINTLRVGLMHAHAKSLITFPEEIIHGSFAASFMSQDTLSLALKVINAQDKAIKEYLARDNAPDIDKLAELGLSLETITELHDYVRSMTDWQLDNCNKLFYGGDVNLTQVQYIVGPIAKRMSELEGRVLGGFLSDVIVNWLSGVTFTHIKSKSKFSARLEELISVIYSRVQYLLPWGLWATDWLVEQEAYSRGLAYQNQLKKLAYLADAGVPNFNALSLFHAGFERVDSTRLSNAYTKSGSTKTGMDLIGWLKVQPQQAIELVINGVDNRGIEHKFFEKFKNLEEE